jgi:hypothetical protein
MPRLPVFATVGRAYSFVFKNLGILYRLCWFPVLIFALPEFVSFNPVANVWKSTTPVLLALAISVAMVVFLVQTFFLSMALVAIHRVILFGDRKPGIFLLFSVGIVELYFTVVPLVVQLGAVGIVVLAILVFGWPTIGPAPGNGLLRSVAFFAAWALGTWVFCRFVAFYPLVVVTERLAIREAWRLSRGNFWRILGVFFFGLLPLFLAGMVAVTLLALFLTPDGLAEMQGVGPTIAQIAMNFVVGIPILALGVAFLCYCFKALAGYAPNDIVPSAVLPLPVPSTERSRD